MTFRTALGWAAAAVSDNGVCAVSLPTGGKRQIVSKSAKNRSADGPAARALLKQTVSQLRRYFSGKGFSFTLPLDLRQYSSFQQAVWRATASIPYGETRSYAWIANKLGKPGAVRAVGNALGTNPVPIIVP